MGYLVVYNRNKVGSYIYRGTDDREVGNLYNAFSCIKVDGLQFVIISDPNFYGEYAPFTEITDLGDLFLIVGGLCKGI